MSEPAPERWFDISGLRVGFSGLSAQLAGAFDAAWSLFESPGGPAAFLDVHVQFGGESVPHGVTTAKTMRVTGDEHSAAFVMLEGRGELNEQGRLEVTLSPSTPSTQYIALLNLVMPSLAWLLARGRGAALHAGGILLEGRAVLLVGASGAGKSSWVRCAASAGARALGDDLVLVDGSRGRLEVLGTPFRPRSFPSPGPGRWPLALVLFARHGTAVRLDEVGRVAARATLLANLPWIEPSLLERAAPPASIEQLLARVPLRRLTFAEDASFVPLLAEFLEGQESGAV